MYRCWINLLAIYFCLACSLNRHFDNNEKDRRRIMPWTILQNLLELKEEGKLQAV